MNEKFLKVLHLYSETPEYAEQVEEANQIIRRALSDYLAERCYVAWSGGKDSTAMLHLVLQQSPNIAVFHWDHGPWLMPRQVEDEILKAAPAIGVKKSQLHIHTTRTLQWEEARWKPQLWYLAFFRFTLPTVCRQWGWKLAFIGFRAEESSKRRAKTRQPIAMKRVPAAECYPIRHWNWLTVWAYILKNRLPYPSIYDTYAALQGYDKVRLVTFFDEEFQEKFGSKNLDRILLWREETPIR